MSLEPARYNFNLNAGATFYKRIFFEVESALQNLERSAVTFVVKDEPEGDTLLELSSKEETITLGGAEGWIDILLQPEQTTEYAAKWPEVVSYRMYLFDDSVGERTDVLMRGTIKLNSF